MVEVFAILQLNTPGTAGGPGGRDRNKFSRTEIPRSGSKAKDRDKKRKEERPNDGNNIGKTTHGARKHAWRTQAAWAKREKKKDRTMVITMAELRMAHASTHGARKPPGPILRADFMGR